MSDNEIIDAIDEALVAKEVEKLDRRFDELSDDIAILYEEVKSTESDEKVFMIYNHINYLENLRNKIAGQIYLLTDNPYIV